MSGLSVGPFPRRDLVLEEFPGFNGSGVYFSDYIDSAYAGSVRIAFWTDSTSAPSGAKIEEHQWDSTSSSLHYLRTQSLSVSAGPGGGFVGYAELPLTGRYFQIILSGADPNSQLALTVRAV